MPAGKYRDLLKSLGFQSFLWTQFLGALNDNLFKIMVSMAALNAGANSSGGGEVSLVGAVFILPFFLFSGYAGHLADVFNKRSVLIATKALEIVAMGLGLFALLSGRMEFLLGVLFLMALQSTFFSPAKYGVLPEMLPDRDLSRANGLLEMSTFMAIVLGTSVGGFMFASWKSQPPLMGMVLVAIAVAGTLASLGISRVPMSGAQQPFRLNPFGEIITGIRRLWSDRTLWLTVVGISYFWFLGALLQMDMLLFGKQVMGLDDYRISILMTALAVGIGVGSLLAGWLSGDKVELGLVPIGSIGLGVFSWLLSGSGASYPSALTYLVLLGLFGGFFIVPLNALLQQKAGQQEKGRLIATNNFLNTAGILLASAALWVCRDKLGLQADRIILIFGLFTLVGTAYVLKILPEAVIRFTLWLLTHSIYRIRVIGHENVPLHGPALLVCNHVSHVDGLLVGSSVQRDIRFMVYRPYYELKALNWLFRLMKAIPVAGRNRQEIMEGLVRAREALRQGEAVCIFAEGSVTRTGHLHPFRRGLERMVSDLNVPVIPVHLDRLWGSIFSFKEGRFFTKWPERIPYPVTITFGQPMPSTSKAHEVRQAVMELGSEAWQHRRTSRDLLHLRFLKTAKRRWFSFALAEHAGSRVTGEAKSHTFEGVREGTEAGRSCPEGRLQTFESLQPPPATFGEGQSHTCAGAGERPGGAAGAATEAESPTCASVRKGAGATRLGAEEVLETFESVQPWTVASGEAQSHTCASVGFHPAAAGPPREAESHTCASVRQGSAGAAASGGAQFHTCARVGFRPLPAGASRSLTFGQALVASLALGRWIRRQRPADDMVGVLLPASIGGALANVALLLAGKVPVNLNFTASREALASAIDQCGIKTVLTSRVFLAKAKLEELPGMVFLEEVLPQISPLQKAWAAVVAFALPARLLQALYRGHRKPDDLATVIFSSGSTGAPKGIMLSHHNVLSNIEGLGQVFWLSQHDRMMGVLPFFHAFGFTGTLWMPLTSGFGVVYHANPLDGKTIGEMVARHKATILISTPTFCGAYLRQCTPEQFRTLRHVVVGAEKLRETLVATFKQKFSLDLLEGYGCTEMSPVVSVNTPDVEHYTLHQEGLRLGTVGHPIPGVAVKIVDPDTYQPLPPGQEGLLLVKGPSRMLGYLGQPEKTAEALRDGWYITGDIASIDDDGFIRITDRLSRFSKLGGEMVPHIKIEETINAILGEPACVVTSVPDEQKGERLVCLYAKPGVPPDDLWAKLSQTDLPKLWLPKRESLYPIESLPVLGSGKIDLRKAKAMAVERAAGAR